MLLRYLVGTQQFYRKPSIVLDHIYVEMYREYYIFCQT